MTISKATRALLGEPTAADDAEVARLRGLTLAELAFEYERAYGAPPRVRRADLMIKRLAWRAQERRTGGLSAAVRARIAELVAEIEPNLPWNRAAAASAAADGVGRGAGNEKGASGASRPAAAKPGAKATSSTSASSATAPRIYERAWNGRVIRVVEAGGEFECDGRRYKSLSAVARAVTGARWNGRLFFRLTDRAAGGGAR